MLQGLSLEARQEALKVFRPLRLRRGAVLFAPGDPVDGVYLVRQGLVGLHRPGPGLEEGVLDVVGPGGVFGEEALGGGA
ncbi:cyclic nucleotide-binding domain-containing protein, partial [Thermus thermophilus]|uniref:cyclic nucleotide-binding domain-containing protein n=1 Tax=Thermus thermophilus TaxID=274 RepID=UPI00241FA35C